MKRHSTDLVSLIFGALFIAGAGWWLVARYYNLRLDIPNMGWFLAAALIGLGLLGVAASLRREPAEAPVAAGTPVVPVAPLAPPAAPAAPAAPPAPPMESKADEPPTTPDPFGPPPTRGDDPDTSA